ncbi:hypothetical protein M0G43_08255 [Subsaxibacter sp. CAU 1640]|uniref:hypothetical protein n=1 Tax=Subsaxibacter sp. CAU 1640 TaxID=2933271 RepID=UPI00200452B7|nr:hypothetical protein [Subsaxibacter sp. CAU 1640]MCK7590561.1 hypothetical protein [Subsaxibacter sp. CAU 1640]
MKYSCIFMVLLFASVFYSCSSDDSDSQNPSLGGCITTIPFLTSDRTMTYSVNGNSGGAVLEFGNCDENGYYITRTIGSSTSTDLYRQNGDFLEVDSQNNGDYFAKVYKLNSQLGESWTHTQSDGTISTHEVVSVDSTITVPAGTFNCKVFSYTTSSIINTSYIFWDDQVGQIKEDAGFFIIELESY